MSILVKIGMVYWKTLRIVVGRHNRGGKKIGLLRGGVTNVSTLIGIGKNKCYRRGISGGGMKWKGGKKRKKALNVRARPMNR